MLADGHLMAVICTARTGMPESMPVMPGIENRRQSAVSAWSRPAPGRSRGLVRGAGCGLVMTGDAETGMVVINVVLCGRLCPGRFNAPLRIAAGAAVSRRLADHSDLLAPAKKRVLLNRAYRAVR